VPAPATRAGLIAAACLAALGCRARGVELQIVGESTRVRRGDPVPAETPWFDGKVVRLAGARGETLGIQVLHRGGGAVTLAIAGDGVTVRGYAVDSLAVTRPSTGMYGGSRGAGAYADGLTAAAAPETDPAYLEIEIDGRAAPGARDGELVVAGRRVPVELVVSKVALHPLAPMVWAYEDPRELAWRSGASEAAGDPSPAELDCIELFARHGVLLSPDLTLARFSRRRALLSRIKYVPAAIPDDPQAVGPVVRDWIAATQPAAQVPFAIPIDEPRTAEEHLRVRALADAVRAAGGGPDRFLYAVTGEPRPEYGDAVDLYISPGAAHLEGDRVMRWTYNGRPPAAGAMVLDAETPGTRTWGWIGWRWNIPVWYVWDALYWHDRHNRRGGPLPGRALDPAVDSVSFDDGEDRGNLDGVLALPSAGGCRGTLRLAALRRGLLDRQLLDLASRCDGSRAADIAARLVPRALGDAAGAASWPTDEAPWELARRQLLTLAASCAP
jgi:hypothetical protein